ncbi:DNA polymerase III subunit delta' [Aquabacterium parvum]|jgi:DNA polymerase-3 subunit delta'|uniref:DNA polymerase III subunit delta' n=1 Tax=Aquabacterium parvum TaxID=70584 RepID=UPI000718DC2E|nr:DNA polymerase III subunit delta' [Aquabacterium parvum]MBU0914805.1 DNA polymerase III subunit delta' [Gammaproteobacteria bacterium]
MSEDRSPAPLWPWLQTPLQTALGQLHHHAVLLHGLPGTGQFEFAMALTRAWLCEQSPIGQPVAPACGRCTACRLLDAGSHPDVMLVLPEALQATLGWDAPDAGDPSEDKSDRKARKPSQDIKVDAIRAVVQFSQNTASRGRAKVVLIHPVERMNAIAANTLLKTLEEPPGQVRFVLSGSALDQLLPTVRSRCQAWSLPSPEVELATQWLMGETGLDAAAAGLLLQASGGQPLTARDRQALGLDARTWPLIPHGVARGEPGPMAAWPLSLVVETLQKLCHDLSRLAVGAQPRYFPRESLPQPPDLGRLNQWAQELGKVRRHADHPWNLPLKMETLMLQARAILRVRPERANPRG